MNSNKNFETSKNNLF